MAERRPYSSGTRPKTPELVHGQLRSNSRERNTASAHALAAYSDVAGTRPKTPELVHGRLRSNSKERSTAPAHGLATTRPKTPELGSEWRSSKGRSAAPVRALAAYSDVGVEAEGNFAASIVGTCQDMCPGETLTL